MRKINGRVISTQAPSSIYFPRLCQSLMGFSEVELTIVGMPTIIGDQERLEISDPLDKDG